MDADLTRTTTNEAPTDKQIYELADRIFTTRVDDAEILEFTNAIRGTPPTERMSDAEREQFLRMDEQFADCNETDVDHLLLLKWVRDGLLDCTHYVVTDKGREVIDAARKAEIERSGSAGGEA